MTSNYLPSLKANMEGLIRLSGQLFDSVDDARDVVDELTLPEGTKRRQRVVNRKECGVKAMNLQCSCNDRRIWSAADAGPAPPRQRMGSSRATDPRYRAVLSCT